MSLALVAIVLAIGAGAVVAVSTREPAAAAIGLAVALVASALLSDPLPSAAILGVRIVTALLIATLIRAGGRGGQRQFSPLGWPAEALLATAAAVAGLGLAVGLASLTTTGGVPLGEPGRGGAGGMDAAALTGMALTVAAGSSLLALGAAPLVHGRQGIRRAIGLVLVTQAILLIRIGVAGPATDLEEIARAALLLASAATGAALAREAAVAHAHARARADGEDADGTEARPDSSAGTPRRPAASR